MSTTLATGESHTAAMQTTEGDLREAAAREEDKFLPEYTRFPKWMECDHIARSSLEGSK